MIFNLQGGCDCSSDFETISLKITLHPECRSMIAISKETDPQGS